MQTPIMKDLLITKKESQILEFQRLFVIAVLPIHIWAFLTLFYALPAWILAVPISEIGARIAYQLMFMLLESGILYGAILLARHFPLSRWYHQNFVACASIFIFWLSILSAFLQLTGARPDLWNPIKSLLAIGGLILLMLTSCGLIYRFHPLSHHLHALLDRFLVLCIGYALLDLLATLFVFVRNLPWVG